MAPSLRELPNEREAEGVYCDEWYAHMVLHSQLWVANLATRSFWDNVVY